jgi:hypothetical protein
MTRLSSSFVRDRQLILVEAEVVVEFDCFFGRPARFCFQVLSVSVVGTLRAEAATSLGLEQATIKLAEKLLQVANANMVKAIRNVSIAKGCDPREYLLIPFGGAAGQHPESRRSPPPPEQARPPPHPECVPGNVELGAAPRGPLLPHR